MREISVLYTNQMFKFSTIFLVLTFIVSAFSEFGPKVYLCAPCANNTLQECGAAGALTCVDIPLNRCYASNDVCSGFLGKTHYISPKGSGVFISDFYTSVDSCNQHLNPISITQNCGDCLDGYTLVCPTDSSSNNMKAFEIVALSFKRFLTLKISIGTSIEDEVRLTKFSNACASAGSVSLCYSCLNNTKQECGASGTIKCVAIPFDKCFNFNDVCSGAPTIEAYYVFPVNSGEASLNIYTSIDTCNQKFHPNSSSLDCTYCVDGVTILCDSDNAASNNFQSFRIVAISLLLIRMSKTEVSNFNRGNRHLLNKEILIINFYFINTEL
ncbi:hypothetical protein PPL_00276 [Heterostelium album PN500]|uniref:Uncharacterized protein n=1 Tax=Heterostelium pallidum (strain ATCC 26659 / Pp 5 / PN500) TaxID=670386 RepID=D3AW09_HETP5|nr:hypothetical protein PPL_00276 [Heterostelium album PN500]EFA86482.1 hypothetical protein PPL_00276 [Heterostelium album PN500]|eukprot:XP_020438587.1 hypothetical protein PPL_00276 [Heterostelium album PN500]